MVMVADIVEAIFVVNMVEVTVGLLDVPHTVEAEIFHLDDLPMVVGLQGAPHTMEDEIFHHDDLPMVVGLLGALHIVEAVIIHLTAALTGATVDIKMAMLGRHATI